MAYGFGSTLGTGTTDQVASALTARSTLRSYACWTNRHGEGGSSQGAIFNGATVADQLLNNITGTKYIYSRRWTNTAAWSITRPSADAWVHVLLTYDGGSTSNIPTIYLDGISQTVTTDTAPTGTLSGTAGAYSLGNNSGGTRIWDGQLAEFAVWNRILTADEAVALAKGFSPLFFRQSLVEYLPMVRDNVSRLLAAPTITGTPLAQPHPKVIFPSSRWRIIAPSSSVQTLSPSLLTNTETFPAPTVSPGVVSVSVPILTNAQTFPSATVTPGAVSVAPPLIASASSLFAPTVSPGAVQIAPSLIGTAEQLFAPALTPGVVVVTAPLIDTVGAVYSPLVSPGAAEIILPALGSSTQIFAPTINPGSVQLQPSLLTNISTIYSPDVASADVLVPAILAISDRAFCDLTVNDRLYCVLTVSDRGAA